MSDARFAEGRQQLEERRWAAAVVHALHPELRRAEHWHRLVPRTVASAAAVAAVALPLEDVDAVPVTALVGLVGMLVAVLWRLASASSSALVARREDLVDVVARESRARGRAAALRLATSLPALPGPWWLPWLPLTLAREQAGRWGLRPQPEASTAAFAGERALAAMDALSALSALREEASRVREDATRETA